jgi:hypothetical protein
MNKPDPIPARIAALKTTPTSALRKQWAELFGTMPPPFNRRYLESRLAYRIQELAYGGLKPETLKRPCGGRHSPCVVSVFWESLVASVARRATVTFCTWANASA